MQTSLVNLKILQKIELLLVALFGVFLPLDQKMIVYLITLLIPIMIYNGVKNNFGKLKFRHLPFGILFLLYVIGLLYSENLDFGLKEIESRLSFVLLPLIFAFSSINYIKYLHFIIWGFVLGCLISSGICQYYAVKCFDEFGARYCYEASHLAHYMHPTYLSMFFIFGATFLVINAFVDFKNLGYRIFSILIASWLFYFVYGFYSIGPWVSFVLMLIVVLFAVFYFAKKMLYFFIATVVLGIVSFLMVSKLDLLESDYNTISSELGVYFENPELYIQENQNNAASTKARIILWNSSIDFIGEHPFGVGTGDVKDELVKMYEEKGMLVFAEEKLNPHNQYLQTGVSIGILGILAFVFSLGYYLWLGFKERNLYLIALVSFFVIACLFESILERQNGIMLLVFFTAILTSHGELKLKTDENDKLE